MLQNNCNTCEIIENFKDASKNVKKELIQYFDEHHFFYDCKEIMDIINKYLPD